MTSYNELTYGPIADSYATKYGVPNDVFRSVLNARSGFDPFYTGVKGEGIAAIVNNSKNPALNMFDPGQQMDLAAQDLADTYKSTGSWKSATTKFNDGVPVDDVFDDSSDPNDAGAVDAMGNPTGSTVGNTENNNGAGAGVFGVMESIKEYARKYAYSAMILVIGILLILATVYVVVTRGTGEK